MNMPSVTVAMPIQGTRVAPRLDCAAELLLVEWNDAGTDSRRIVPVVGMNMIQIMRIMSFNGATLLVCGCCPGFCRRMADTLRIRVFHRDGEVEDVLRDLKEELDGNQARCHRRRRRRESIERCGPREDDAAPRPE